MKIDVRMLEEHGACYSAVARFRRLFGAKGGVVTKAKCLKVAPLFDWDWAATYLLPASAARLYHSESDVADYAYDQIYIDECSVGITFSARVKAASRELARTKAIAFWKASKLAKSRSHA